MSRQIWRNKRLHKARARRNLVFVPRGAQHQHVISNSLPIREKLANMALTHLHFDIPALVSK